MVPVTWHPVRLFGGLPLVYPNTSIYGPLIHPFAHVPRFFDCRRLPSFWLLRIGRRPSGSGPRPLGGPASQQPFSGQLPNPPPATDFACFPATLFGRLTVTLFWGVFGGDKWAKQWPKLGWIGLAWAILGQKIFFCIIWSFLGLFAVLRFFFAVFWHQGDTWGGVSQQPFPSQPHFSSLWAGPWPA